MELSQKELLIKEIKEQNSYSIEAIKTNNFDGIWYLVDGHECILLTNDERRYADNNIVDGRLEDSFEIEHFNYGYLCSNC
jgi:hypothetical protein